MARSTRISLDARSEAFIREQIQSGEYSTASEVLRDALRLMEREKRREAAFYEALRVGMNSPRAKDGVFERLRKRHGIAKLEP